MDNIFITQEIRKMVTHLLTRNEGETSFANHDSLVISGRMSSLQVVELATLLEKQFNIDFHDGFNQYDFDSIDNLVKLVTSKKNN